MYVCVCVRASERFCTNGEPEKAGARNPCWGLSVEALFEQASHWLDLYRFTFF
jgi:hypothetical protein